NEDCGQMSAWGVWSMAGLYPANPAGGQYVFGSPRFDEVKFHLGGSKSFIIRTINGAKDHPYIQSIRFNNKPYTKTYIEHAIMMQGGVLEFTMDEKPNKEFGHAAITWPASSKQ
ncbi:MAG: glycoside hydrolase domain-containing protein, partial [Ferruginibacter sp.]